MNIPFPSFLKNWPISIMFHFIKKSTAKHCIKGI